MSPKKPKKTTATRKREPTIRELERRIEELERRPFTHPGPIYVPAWPHQPPTMPWPYQPFISTPNTAQPVPPLPTVTW